MMHLETIQFRNGEYPSLPNGMVCEPSSDKGPGNIVFRITKDIPNPVHLHFHAGATPPHIFLHLEPGVTATLLETYGGPGNSGVNTVTRIQLKEAASLDLYRVQEEDKEAHHSASLFVDQKKDSRFSVLSVAMGANVSRLEMASRLKEPGSFCQMNGLFFGAGHQQVEHQTRVDHLSPFTTSRSLFKGILRDQSRGIFDGRVVVHPGAFKSDAQLTTKNILLSDEAEMDPKPELEIYADDVKCAHGATVGQLDESALFYLRSRGIPAAMAQDMLVHAFAKDVLDRATNLEIREWIQEKLKVLCN